MYICIGIFLRVEGIVNDSVLDIRLKIDGTVPEMGLLWFMAMAVLVDHVGERKSINDISRDMPKLNVCTHKNDYLLEVQCLSKALFGML